MNPVIIGNAILYHGDALEKMQHMPAVGHVITDPPFEAEAHTQQRRALGRGQEHGRMDIQDAALPFAAITPEQRLRAASHIGRLSSGWALVFCQAEAVAAWRDALQDGGAKWRRAMVWIKPDGMPQFAGDRPGMGYESIAAAWCGEGASKWNGGGKHGVYTFPKHDAGMGHGGGRNDHPTTKPQRLMCALVSDFTQPRDLIFDPFMGSGSTGVACLSLGRRFVGVEADADYFALACERIEQAQKQQRLFA